MSYYITQTGDYYFRSRIDDAVGWALQAFYRTKHEYGWGDVGWVSEQFYHTYDRYHCPEGDGTVWVAYFPWTAGALLEAYSLGDELGLRVLDVGNA